MEHLTIAQLPTATDAELCEAERQVCFTLQELRARRRKALPYNEALERDCRVYLAAVRDAMDARC